MRTTKWSPSVECDLHAASSDRFPLDPLCFGLDSMLRTPRTPHRYAAWHITSANASARRRRRQVDFHLLPEMTRLHLGPNAPNGNVWPHLDAAAARKDTRDTSCATSPSRRQRSSTVSRRLRHAPSGPAATQARSHLSSARQIIATTVNVILSPSHAPPV